MTATATAPVLGAVTDPGVTESISRADYAHREHLGTAGPVSALGENPVIAEWTDRYPQWRGRYWGYRSDSDTGALLLFPLNVRRRTRTTP
ncbi:hypothetical protein [Nocardia thailandica]